MYFSLSPNIQYDSKPVKFPFSQSDYVVANNFFRRYQINPDKFSYSVFFKRYAIKEGDRWDTIAEMAYSTPLYDWILILTNNVINPQFDMPVSEYELRELVENPDDIAYYETTEFKNTDGDVVQQEGLKVDAAFRSREFTYVNSRAGGTLTYSSTLGSNISIPVTNFTEANRKNEKSREIYILKSEYLQEFVNEFKKQSFYSKSTNYVGKQLKKSGI
tara:strand:+ start:4077 stop:4727 length:651 start_codon:yes stop_codon:yes gene_type:complete